MKTTFLLIFALFILVSCSKTDNNKKSQKTVITGHISNFDKVSEHDFIYIAQEDLLAGQTKTSSTIDEDGNFRIELNVDHPSDLYLRYSGLITFFISPGDSIHITIDGNCWNKISETYTEEYNFYKVSGTAAEMNAEIFKFSAFFLDSLNNWKYQDSILKISTPLEYKDFITKQTIRNRQIIDDFNQKNNTSEEFRKWVDLKLKFMEWDNLMRYRWLYPMYEKTDVNNFTANIPGEYFDFLNTWDKENRTYFCNMDYLNFIHEYSMYVDQQIPPDSMQYYRENFKDKFGESTRILLKYYSEMETGLIKDILIAKYYYRMLDAKYYTQLKEVFNPGLISDENLRTKVTEKFNREEQLFGNQIFAEGTKLNELKNETDFLQELTKKYHGKVIYIDFWAPWCSPCMNEMPNSKKIKESFEGKDVVFVYLANRCNEEAWKSTIAEKKIEGEHYLLTDKQYSKLCDILPIHGIPHYALIDKKGNIVNENAPRPSNAEELTKTIESYLN